MTYNGRTNRDSWNLSVWLSNDQSIWNTARSFSTPDELKTWATTQAIGSIDGINYNKVNWQEVFDGLHDE